MRVIYLDQFVLSKIVCPEGSPYSDELRELKTLLTELADCRAIVCPFSWAHIEELSNDDDRPRQEAKVSLLEKLSQGRAFRQPKHILAAQARAHLQGRPSSDCSRDEGIAEALVPLRDLVGSGLRTKPTTRNLYWEVAHRWASLPKPNREVLEREEFQTYHRMFVQTSLDLLSGRCSPEFYIGFIDSAPMEVFVEASEVYTEQGHPDPVMAAVEFLKDKIHLLCSVRIESKLWSHYAVKLKGAKVPPEKVDHMARDIDAAAYCFPYCDAVFHDAELIDLCSRVRDPAHRSLATFKRNEFTKFAAWLEQEAPGP
jgi:hypothetical protein